jgi:hypothetical protein
MRTGCGGGETGRLAKAVDLVAIVQRGGDPAGMLQGKKATRQET